MRQTFKELLGDELYNSDCYQNSEIELIRVVFNETEKHPVNKVLHLARMDILSDADKKMILEIEDIN